MNAWLKTLARKRPTLTLIVLSVLVVLIFGGLLPWALVQFLESLRDCR